jgi:tetratricopeptide (TPR) repeat protein
MRGLATAIRSLPLLCALILFVGPAAGQPANSADAHDTQARAYFRTQAFERAAEEFRRAYEIDKKPARLFNIGLAYEKAGKKDKARAAYDEYLQIVSTGDRAVEARARKEALDKQLTEEEKLQEAARAKAAADATAAQLAAKAAELSQAGEHDKAAASYQSAYESNGDTKYLFRRAEAFRQGTRTEEAIAAYRHYRTTAPNGVYQGEARRRQEELEEKLARASRGESTKGTEEEGKLEVIAPPPPRKADGSGLRLTSYIAGGLAVAAFGTSIYFNNEFERRQERLANGETEDEVGDPGDPDIIGNATLSTSFMGLSTAGLCYLLGHGDKRDSSGMMVSSCVIGGMGVGALAFAALLGSEAAALGDELDNADFNGQWTENNERDVSRGNVYNTVVTAHVIAGLSGVAAGALLFFLSPDDDSSSGGEGLTIVPTLDDADFGVTGTLRF